MNAKIEGSIKDIKYLVSLWEKFDSSDMIKEPIIRMSIATKGLCNTLEIVRDLR